MHLESIEESIKYNLVRVVLVYCMSTLWKHHHLKLACKNNVHTYIKFKTNYYEGRSVSSRIVLLIKHQENTEYQNYSEVVPPLTYTTYHDFIYDVMQ